MARHIFEQPIDDRHDRNVFFLAFAAGLVGILSTRIIGDQFADPARPITLTDFIALLLSIAVITLYTLFIIRSSERSAISMDRAGDNAYYLGLLFTLISLAYSLYKVAEIVISSSGGLGVDASPLRHSDRVVRLLPDFGLALGSTIAGITCRVLIQQYRNDPADIETQARQALGQAVADLRTSLLRAVADMNTLSQATNAATTEMVIHINKTLEEAAESNATTIAGIGSKLDEVAQKFANEVGKVSEFFEALVREINTVSESASAATKEMVIRINKTLEEAATVNAASITRFGSKMEDVARETGNHAKNISALSEGMVRKIGEVIAGVNEKFSSFDIDPTQVQEQLSSLSTSLKELQNQLSTLSQMQESIARDLAAASTHIATVFSPDAVSRLRTATEETARRQEEVSSRLDGLSTQVLETSQRISDLSEVISKTGEDLARKGETSGQVLSSTVIASSQYIEELAAAAKKLRRSISDES